MESNILIQDTNYMEIIKNKKINELKDRDIHLILEGDWGGQIYLSVPVDKINCDIDGDVDRAAKWIVPVAKQTAIKLKLAGLNPSRTTFIGHSLGTILASEISREFKSSAKGILLDAPSQLSYGTGFATWGYDIDGHTNGNQIPGVSFDQGNYYEKSFIFSRSFTGTPSVAGNVYLGATSHESLQVSYRSATDIKDMHFDILNIVNSLFAKKQLPNNILDITNVSSTSILSNSNLGNKTKGIIYTDLGDKNNPNYLYYKNTNNQFAILGTNSDDYISDYTTVVQAILSGGRDTIQETNSLAVLNDFSYEDKMKLSPSNSLPIQNYNITNCGGTINGICIEKRNTTTGFTVPAFELRNNTISFDLLRDDLDRFKIKPENSLYFTK
jgi:hypothetical protein